MRCNCSHDPSGVHLGWYGPGCKGTGAGYVDGKLVAAIVGMQYQRACIRCSAEVRSVNGANASACLCHSLHDGDITPKFWVPYNALPPSGYAPQQPADDGNCAKCGKELSFVGLRQVHPPKRDEQGRVICPHCGYVHGAVGQGGGNSNLFNAMAAADFLWDRHTCTGGAPCRVCDIAKGY